MFHSVSRVSIHVSLHSLSLYLSMNGNQDSGFFLGQNPFDFRSRVSSLLTLFIFPPAAVSTCLFSFCPFNLSSHMKDSKHTITWLVCPSEFINLWDQWHFTCPSAASGDSGDPPTPVRNLCRCYGSGWEVNKLRLASDVSSAHLFPTYFRILMTRRSL